MRQWHEVIVTKGSCLKNLEKSTTPTRRRSHRPSDSQFKAHMSSPKRVHQINLWDSNDANRHTYAGRNVKFLILRQNEVSHLQGPEISKCNHPEAEYWSANQCGIDSPQGIAAKFWYGYISDIWWYDRRFYLLQDGCLWKDMISDADNIAAPSETADLQ